MISDSSKQVAAFFCRPHRKLVLLLLALVFSLGLWFRLSVPAVPLFNPDSWGYMHPALSEIAGSGFQQTHGRGIAYPLFLLGVLSATEDFQSITVAQHAMGIFAGIVWWVAWISWCSWLPSVRASAFWVQCIGIVFLASFLLNASTILHESAIRPEAIFPALALGQICLCLIYARARWGSRRPVIACLSGAFSVLLAFICLSVKPSWGFAAMIPFGLLLLGVCGKGLKKDVFVRAAPLLLAGCLAASWFKLVPSAFGWIPEKSAGNFLPATLFSVHAPVIAKLVQQRIDEGSALPGEAEFLGSLERRIDESRKVSPPVYTILGHDPDYLMYRSGVLGEISGLVPPGEEREYMFTAFRDAALFSPLESAGKVLRQMRAAFSDLSQTLYRNGYRYDLKLEDSIRLMDSSRLPNAGDGLEFSYSKVRAESADLLENSNGKVRLGPGLNGLLARIVGPLFLGFWVLAWPFLTIAIVSRREWFQPPGLPGAILAMGILWAACLGSALTVAVVHSFDINRYLHLLSAPQSLFLAASVIVSACWVACYFAGRFPNRVREEVL